MINKISSSYRISHVGVFYNFINIAKRLAGVTPHTRACQPPFMEGCA